MSSLDQHQAPPTSYPPPGQAYPPPAEGYPANYAAPPPVGYPVKDEAAAYPSQAPVETKSRGEGFWEGCCAALCCCCVLDTCF
uniref:Cysteine-rich and transmembrane domain-containing protein B n=1 Tax=Elaeis guineensis var. tenera TaxID=51953 RepID=A0A6I9S488_ELAGV|nr:cysteine-rich and transmembrane domain-containing protein B [Elaeis guineensis]